jgi:hypothetical protein
MIKRTVLVLGMLSILFASVFARPALAQIGTPWYNQSYRTWTARVFDHTNDTEIFGERYTFAQVQWIVYSLMTIVTGSDIIACLQPLNTETIDISAEAEEELKNCFSTLAPVEEPAPEGSINSPNIAYSDILSPTSLFSGVSYTKSLIQSFKLTPEAQAQGFGYTNALKPVQELWKAMRNIAYLFLTVGIVIMAFMVMFRVKISPQAVITVQSALPKIVIALLAITFSYAIAGFIIDLINLAYGIFIILIQSQDLTTLQSPTDIPGLFAKLNSPAPIFGIVGMLIIFVIVMFLFSGAIFFIPILGIASGFTFLMALLALCLAIALLIIMLRIFWIMIKALTMTVLLVVFAPLILLGTMFSTEGGGFTSWIRSLFAQLVIFPVIGIMVWLSHFFFWSYVAPKSGPLKILAEIAAFGFDGYGIYGLDMGGGSFAMPGFPESFTAVTNMSLIGLLISIGVLFLVPHAANIVKSLVERKPFAYGTAIGQGLTMAAMPITAAWNRSAGIVSGGIEKGFQQKISNIGTPQDPRT